MIVQMEEQCEFLPRVRTWKMILMLEAAWTAPPHFSPGI